MKLVLYQFKKTSTVFHRERLNVKHEKMYRTTEWKPVLNVIDGRVGRIIIPIQKERMVICHKTSNVNHE